MLKLLLTSAGIKNPSIHHALVDMLGILPVLKQIGSFLSGVVTFVITLVLWLLATLVAIVLQNLWLLIAVVVIVIAGAYFLVSRRQQVRQPSH